MKGWKKGLLIAGSIIVGLGFIGAMIDNAELETELRLKDNPPIESEEAEKTVEPEPVETPEPPVEETTEPRTDLRGVYTDVHLGMTEAEVRNVAGEPDMVSTSEVEGFGTMKDLMYDEGMDTVSVYFENGEVKMVIIGTWNGGDLDTKTKM